MARPKKPYTLYPRGGRSKKKGDAIFYVSYRDPITGLFGTGRSTHETTRKAAETWAQRHLDSAIQDDSPICDFLRAFLQPGSAYLAYVTNRKGAPSPSQLSHSRSKIEAYIIPSLEELKIRSFSQLSIAKLEAMQDLIITKGIKARTMNEAFQVFHKALEWAAKENRIDFDPFVGYQAYRHQKRKRGTLTKEEVKSLWQLEMRENERLLFFIILFTGLRTGEIQALQYGDIETEKIHVIRSWESREGFKGPKGSKADYLKDRYTCLPKALSNIIASLRGDAKKSELIFPPNSPKSQVLRNDFIGNLFKNRLYEIKISEEMRTERYLTYYSGRHFFNSFLVEKNVPYLTIANLMGHTGNVQGMNSMTVNYFSPQTDYHAINKLFDDFIDNCNASAKIHSEEFGEIIKIQNK
jgi:integrase